MTLLRISLNKTGVVFPLLASNRRRLKLSIDFCEATERPGTAEQAWLSDGNPQATSSVSLGALRVRGTYRVTELKLAGEDEARIKNMGICVGRRIEILQPGDPLIIKVSGASVGVSRRLAVGILLESLVSTSVA